jgi:hypothetical protein
VTQVREYTVERNPYAPPTAEVADVGLGAAAPALWNPGAAANWSLLFSPVFGAFLHMKNWQALGEPAKAATAKLWVISTLVITIGVSVAAILMPANNTLGGISRLIGFVLLIGWYASSGRGQMAYVKTQFGKDYPRKGWGIPLLLALLALFGFIAFTVGISLLTVGVRGRV